MKLYGIIILSIVLLGCNYKNKPKKPDNLIPKDTMVAIIINTAILNSANAISKEILENNGIVKDRYIYNRFNIDSLQLAQSNAYYAYHITDYEAIINTVNDSLKQLQDFYKTTIDSTEKDTKPLKNSVLDSSERTPVKKLPDSLLINPIKK